MFKERASRVKKRSVPNRGPIGVKSEIWGGRGIS